MQIVALIDYGAGNLRSVERALEAAAREAATPSKIVLTDDAEIARGADRIVLPGQGAFDDCMAGLEGRAGMIGALEDVVLRRGAPFLGICVGHQLLAETGLEHGARKGLGWLGGVCRPLKASPETRIPHMGWNEAIPTAAHPVLAPLQPARHVYFCHSYVLDPPADAVRAVADHGERFCCAAGRDNIIGVQFHPEKSQQAGLALLAAFLDWKP